MLCDIVGVEVYERLSCLLLASHVTYGSLGMNKYKLNMYTYVAFRHMCYSALTRALNLNLNFVFTLFIRFVSYVCWQ